MNSIKTIKKEEIAEGKEKHDKILEMGREIFHIIIGIAIIWLSMHFGSRILWMLFFILIFGMAISLLSIDYNLPFFGYMLDRFERKKYRRTFPGKGVLFFVAGSMLVLKLFILDWGIAFAAIAILTAGDFASRLVRYTKPRLGKFSKKSIYGTLLGIVAATIAGSFFINPLYAFIGSFAAMMAENFSLKVGLEEVDDNIIVPLVAGTAMYLLLKIQGIL